MSQPCILRQGIFDRWFIFHPHNIVMAWSGSQWVTCSADGVPHMVQVCNFPTKEEAAEYCRQNDLAPQEPVV